MLLYDDFICPNHLRGGSQLEDVGFATSDASQLTSLYPNYYSVGKDILILTAGQSLANL